MKRCLAVAWRLRHARLRRNDSASIAFLQRFYLNPYGSRLIRKRRLSPIPVELQEQLAILCDKALQAFDAKLCQRLVRRPDA
jgi:hypothetical protein